MANRRYTQSVNVFSTVGRNYLHELNQKAQKDRKVLEDSGGDWWLEQANNAPTEVVLIKQHLTKHVLQWQHKPVKLRLFVLVTSMNPLRTFLYADGMVLPYETIDNGVSFDINQVNPN